MYTSLRPSKKEQNFNYFVSIADFTIDPSSMDPPSRRPDRSLYTYKFDPDADKYININKKFKKAKEEYRRKAQAAIDDAFNEAFGSEKTININLNEPPNKRGLRKNALLIGAGGLGLLAAGYGIHKYVQNKKNEQQGESKNRKNFQYMAKVVEFSFKSEDQLRDDYVTSRKTLPNKQRVKGVRLEDVDKYDDPFGGVTPRRLAKNNKLRNLAIGAGVLAIGGGLGIAAKYYANKNKEDDN